MHVEDPYHELGLPPGSSDAEVKAAWRRLSARWHPDRNSSPQALRKIQRINRALEEIRRARGELVPEADQDPRDQPAQAAQSRQPMAEHPIDLTLEEIATGCIKEVSGELVEDCASCDGTGLEPQEAACGECDGTGNIRQALWFGWVSSTVMCKTCDGRGSTRQRCGACEATGKTVSNYRCRARISPGVRDGDLLNVTAHVQAGRRRQDVALRLRVQLQPHDLFDVEPDGTVTCEVPVDGFAWMANRWIEVPTPRGLQQMRLRREFLSYRIREAGLPWGPGASTADCIMTVVPMFPDELSPDEEDAIDRLVLANSGAADTPAGQRMAQWKSRVDACRNPVE